MPKSTKDLKNGNAMKRSNSLPQVAPDEEKEKQRTPKLPTSHSKSYRGRYSMGRHATGSKAPVVSRGSKSKKASSNLTEDDTEVYYTSPTKRNNGKSLFRLFNCIPVIDNQDNQSPIESLSRKTSFGSSLSTPPPTQDNTCGVVGVDDVKRNKFFEEFSSFLDKDKTSSTSKLIINQPLNKDEQKFTIGGKREKHKFGDYMWLILKAYFAGKDVSGRNNDMFQYDDRICQLRTERNVILKKISQFKLDHEFARHIPLTPDYVQCFHQKRKDINNVLEEFDRFEILFPHRKAMYDECKGENDMEAIEERIAILNAWTNSADQLLYKMEQLGTMLGVDESEDGAAGWPRPRLGVAPLDREKALGLVKTFVAKSLIVKGMRRVLYRFSDICEELLLRIAILLQLPARSYAQAAGTRRCVIHITPEMREKYGDRARGLLRSETAISMNLPSLVPLFLFVLGVRVQLVLEWLGIRAESNLPIDSEMDHITLDTLVEDSRDCIEEAVRVKRHYQQTVTGVCYQPRGLLPPEFDDNLGIVFKNYLQLVSQWSTAVTRPPFPSSLSAQVFSRLEREWNAARAAAPSIHDGLTQLSQTFCNVMSQVMRAIVISYWDQEVDDITTKMDDSGNEEDVVYLDTQGDEMCRIAGEEDPCYWWSIYDLLDDQLANHSLDRCRKLNKLALEVQERACRAMALIRAAMNNLLFVSTYLPVSDYLTITFALRDHYLISFTSPSTPWPLTFLCDDKTASSVTVEAALRTIFEGMPLEHGHCISLPVPYEKFVEMWKYRRIDVQIEANVEQYLQAFHNDRAIVFGSFPLHKKYPSAFRLCSSSSAAHVQLHAHMQDFATHLDADSNRVWLQVCTIVCALSSDFGGSTDSSNRTRREATLSALRAAFNFTFQLYRDIGRIVWEVQELRADFASRCVSILECWRDVVCSMEFRRSPHIPLWAKNAFTFMHNFADPIWTRYMSEEMFTRLRNVLDECIKLIIGRVEDIDQTPVEKEVVQNKKQNTHRSRSTEGQSRSEVLRKAIDIIDEKVEKDQRIACALGRIVVKGRDEYTPSNYTNISRKVPFKWQMYEKIGEGQFGDVYKAINADKQCVMAVKQIRVNGKLLKILEGEVDILRNLSHPNLVKYYGFEVLQETDRVLLFMEFCAEGTLEKICREGMDNQLVRRYTNHLLQAVAYIHEHKVIHRDIKPANIFLDLACVLKLGDFGSSTRLHDDSTVHGEMLEYIGTPNYMAPEIQTGGKKVGNTYGGYGRAVDIWSVGCVVLEMESGRRPWSDLNMFEITMRVGNSNRPEYPQNCLYILSEFLDACFEFDATKRRTADALLQFSFANIHVDPQQTIDNR